MNPDRGICALQSITSSRAPSTEEVCQISARSASKKCHFEKNKFASFPYLKMHQKIRIFASTRSQLYRRIFRFSLHFRVEYDPISPQKLKISAASTKKWWKISTQNAKNAILTHFFDLEKNFSFFSFFKFKLDLNEFQRPVKKKSKNLSITKKTNQHKFIKFIKISSILASIFWIMLDFNA